MRKILAIVLIVCVLFSVSCKKNKEAVAEETLDQDKGVTVNAQEIGAEYVHEKLGFTLELTEYWYTYTQITEYKDYVVFSFDGESEFAKDMPILYIGEKKALEKLGLEIGAGVEDIFYAYNSEIDELIDNADSANRDIGVVQILKLELDEVVSSIK